MSFLRFPDTLKNINILLQYHYDDNHIYYSKFAKHQTFGNLTPLCCFLAMLVSKLCHSYKVRGVIIKFESFLNMIFIYVYIFIIFCHNK